MADRKPRVVLSCPPYRIVAKWDLGYLEKHDGEDGMGVKRWRMVANDELCAQEFADYVAKAMLTRAKRLARSRRKGVSRG